MRFLRTRNSKLMLCGLLLAAIFVTAALFWNSTGKRPPPRGPAQPGPATGPPLEAFDRPDDTGWLGSRKCAACHREIWERYQGHPMAHSLAPVDEALVLEDYEQHTSFRKPESREYRVERRHGRVFHHELMTAGDGTPIYDQGVEVHFALGSGKRGRSYLIDRGGVMFVSPITWYAAAGRWDLSPGYIPRNHQRFERRVEDACLICHVGRMTFDRDLPDRQKAPPFFEQAIGCERCHGPGAAHVRRHESRDEPWGDDPIVNPARLEPAARDDTCNQCHLQAALRLPRSGRTMHDFRAGQRLEDVWAVFARGPDVSSAGATRAVNQVDQMRASTCFRSSAGGLGCISCHDPHGVPAQTERASFYTGRCQACHADKGCSLPLAEQQALPAAGACVECHMRRLPAGNVPHTSQTDHRILRRPDAAPRRPAVREFELFDGAETRLPPFEIERARSLKDYQALLRRPHGAAADELEPRLRALVELSPTDVELLEALGVAAMAQRRTAEARRCWLRVLELRPQHEGALQRLAILEGETGDPARAVTYMERYARINPWRGEFHGRFARLLSQAGDDERALAEAVLGVELDPALLPLRQWLAEAYRRAGRADEARREEQLIERLRGK